jgi:hypothetical protein
MTGYFKIVPAVVATLFVPVFALAYTHGDYQRLTVGTTTDAGIVLSTSTLHVTFSGSSIADLGLLDTGDDGQNVNCEPSNTNGDYHTGRLGYWAFQIWDVVRHEAHLGVIHQFSSDTEGDFSTDDTFNLTSNGTDIGDGYYVEIVAWCSDEISFSSSTWMTKNRDSNDDNSFFFGNDGGRYLLIQPSASSTVSNLDDLIKAAETPDPVDLVSTTTVSSSASSTASSDLGSSTTISNLDDLLKAVASPDPVSTTSTSTTLQ